MEKTNSDLQCICDIATHVARAALEIPKESEDFSKFVDKNEVLPQGEPIRVVLPHGYQPIKSILVESASSEDAVRDAYFVGFCSTRLPNADDNTLREVYATDDKLVEELKTQPGMYSFLSCKMTSGDVGVLTLVRDMEAANQWRRVKTHADAIRDLAPSYYKEARVYRGMLTLNLAARTAKVKLLSQTSRTRNEEGKLDRVYRSYQQDQHQDACVKEFNI